MLALAVLVRFFGDRRSDHNMAFINITKILAQGYNLTPLEKTWYEEEVDGDETKTIRFAKRKDHTGVLVQINKADFYSDQ